MTPDARDADVFPTVAGSCPACGASSLFLGAGGHVTCSRIDCLQPDAASTILERHAEHDAKARREAAAEALRDACDGLWDDGNGWMAGLPVWRADVEERLRDRADQIEVGS